MNLRTAIVEDSKPDAERLKQLLKKAFENENISCSCFASGDEFLRAGWREGYQVVFLDICMEGTNGIDTARTLHRDGAAAARRRSGAAHRVCDILAGVRVGCLSGTSIRLSAQAL